MMGCFCHLHGHTTFSFLDGMGTPEQVARRVKELGHTHVAVTDHGNVFAHVPWMKAAKKHDLRVIYGMEAYIVPDKRDRGPVLETRGAGSFPHITLLARTQEGYHNLMRLHKVSWEEGYYYKPRIGFEDLWRHQAGLTVLSGCVGGWPMSHLMEGNPDRAHGHMAMMSRNVEHYWAEFIPTPGYGDRMPGSLLDQLAAIAADLRIPPVMTSDAHFPHPDDHVVQDIMLAIGTGQRVNAPDRKMRLLPYHYYCDEIDMMERTLMMGCSLSGEWVEAALTNTSFIAQQCEEVRLPKAERVTYAGLALGESSEDRLWSWVQRGAGQRMARGLIPRGREAEYHARASLEFSVIRSKGFCDYVLAVADIVAQAKARNQLVMLRGSAGGSLLLWLLGASETDPILHGLSFERFYDDNRPDPPDVDMDFELRKRDESIQYVFATYGQENCAQISALSQIKAKQAVVDTAKAFGIPRAEFGALANALDSADDEVERQIDALDSPEAKTVLLNYPQLRVASRLVGQYRQQSIHAAGVIISPTPLGDSIGVVKNRFGRPVVSVDKKGAAELGYLKMDMLAVNNYDVVAETVRRAGLPVSMLYDLPLDDENALATANAGHLAGVFQLSGGSALKVSRAIKINTFEDVVAASALCRPGPGDWVQIYRDNKVKEGALDEYLGDRHPIAQDIVRPTFGILLYQEQVMRMAREMAGFDWPDVHKLRKGVVDKLGLDPNNGPAWEAEWMGKFLAGCAARGVDQEEALFWWGSIKTHGGYSFNKSHCTTYAQVGYWMLWLKTYYRDLFYETYLQLDDDNMTRKHLVREYIKTGGQVYLFDTLNPTARFTCPRPGVIVGGFADLKGIGDSTVEAAMAKTVRGDGFIDSLGESHARKIRDAGAHNGDWDTQRMIVLAPWFPVQVTNEVDRASVFGADCTRISDLIGTNGQPTRGEVWVPGYVTNTMVDDERIVFTLEDEGGLVTARVPLASVAVFRQDNERMMVVGDYVAMLGWWQGEVLYIKKVIIAREAVDIARDSARAKAVRDSQKAMATGESALGRYRKYHLSKKPAELAKADRAREQFLSCAERIRAGAFEHGLRTWYHAISDRGDTPAVEINDKLADELQEADRIRNQDLEAHLGNSPAL